MIFTGLEVGPLGTNCYIIGCAETGFGAVIDPGDEDARILEQLQHLKLKCQYIILTHGHVDHIGAVGEVHAATGAAVCIHQADAERLVNPARYSLLPVDSVKPKTADRLLKDGDKIQVGKTTLEVIHTPGHTPGGVCLKTEDILFTGDTLFAGSVGRSDLPGGSHNQLINSIKTKLLAFPDATKVYPGHGPASTIGAEKKFNPFL
ncbi:MBL fold metallo-hydrolase [Desulfoscipio geothermicus]|uniref:Glyoxylase, beta-lactamase superfamily II n=1 Tax=Desulfoscipio geothermicus DSM 3669 TaxID=1121426 RepID=A0A1I6DCB8_9FIRM|nr:MBL fold metallo-hydrolase [Desulfoscipio geothermicus]SFR03048.1 Glyoxylase, beta-lactamase superfamily II [Desulfoscipio geothermicus DSM 3669]